MNRKADNELLDDVLGEAAPINIREAMLGQSLRLVRRRRRFRQTRNAAGTIVALALAGILVWQRTAPQIAKAAENNYTLIHTRPLPPNEIVSTRSRSVAQIDSSTPVLEIVQTTTGNFLVIGDEELLALMASHPAILVRTGPRSEELVFANPKDAKGFPVN